MDALTILLPIAAVGLAVATVWLSTHRTRVVAILGLELVLALLLLRLAVDSIVAAVASSLADPQRLLATEAVLYRIAGDLLRLDVLAIALGVLALIVGLALEPRVQRLVRRSA